MVREVVGFSDIPPLAYELAVILQFGTSYELVEWLARRLQEVSERMAQEHRDQIMIQKSLSGTVEPEEQQELHRIGQERSAKNRTMYKYASRKRAVEGTTPRSRRATVENK